MPTNYDSPKPNWLERIASNVIGQVEYKILLCRGTVWYLIIPSQDGQMTPEGDWIGVSEILREDNLLFNIYCDQPNAILVGIEATCHRPNGSIDWDKVETLDIRGKYKNQNTIINTLKSWYEPKN